MSTAASLSALLKGSTIVDHKEVLEQCNQALKVSKSDPGLLHTKVVALLKLDRFAEAIQLFKDFPDQLDKRAAFERAYALYKLGHLKEAQVIASQSSTHRGLQHVQAQASYRAEQFSHAIDAYKTLIDSKAQQEDNESDLRINLSATEAQLNWMNPSHSSTQTRPSRQDLEIFETAYNFACNSIARGELEQGLILLKRSQEVCQTSEELSGEEKAAEILPIRVQQLYVLGRLGRHQEAQTLAGELSTQETSDVSTQLILQNNVVTIMSEAPNPYLQRRNLGQLSQTLQADQLFSYQADALEENNLILDLNAHKNNAVIEATDPIITKGQPTTSKHVNTFSILNAAARMQQNLANQGLKQILPLFEKRPLDVGLALTIVQLYLLTPNHGSALHILEKLLSGLELSQSPSSDDIRFSPGLVNLQISLYKAQNRKSQIISAFAAAAQHWVKKTKPPTALLEAAGASLLLSPNHHHRDLVREIFTLLRTADPKSKLAAAGFVASHASDPLDTEMQEALSLLPSLEEQTRGIDVDALLEAGVALPPESAASLNRKRPLDEKSKPRKKRVRKSRLPKDFDPNKKLDPERWLPLRDRSSYRAPKKKGKKRDAERDRTQGGAVNDKPPAKVEEAAKASEKPTASASGGGKSKGKKKGKR